MCYCVYTGVIFLLNIDYVSLENCPKIAYIIVEYIFAVKILNYNTISTQKKYVCTLRNLMQFHQY